MEKKERKVEKKRYEKPELKKEGRLKDITAVPPFGYSRPV